MKISSKTKPRQSHEVFPLKKIKTFKLVNYLPVNVSVVVISVVVMFDLTKNRKEKKKYTHLTFSI